jgi:hypothetical protein
MGTPLKEDTPARRQLACSCTRLQHSMCANTIPPCIHHWSIMSRYASTLPAYTPHVWAAPLGAFVKHLATLFHTPLSAATGPHRCQIIQGKAHAAAGSPSRPALT